MAREMADAEDNRYMGEWTTPVSVVLYVYSLISFMVFLFMFMLYVSRHGCFVSGLLYSLPAHP